MTDRELNKGYPEDYKQYLDECFDQAKGNVRCSYEAWKANQEAAELEQRYSACSLDYAAE